MQKSIYSSWPLIVASKYNITSYLNILSNGNFSVVSNLSHSDYLKLPVTLNINNEQSIALAIIVIVLKYPNSSLFHFRQWRSNQIAEPLIMRIPQPHIQCVPVYSALLAVEDQVIKSVFRS